MKITPRERSIREMYRAIMKGRAVKVKLDWMTARFYLYEGDGRDYIACVWHGRTACRATLTAFRASVLREAKLGYNFKRGPIEFATED